MKKIHAAAAALLLAAFVLSGCSASGRVSSAKDGIVRDEHEETRRDDEGLIDDVIEYGKPDENRTDINGTNGSEGGNTPGTAANSR
ncbi:MAG: hypothetical protein II784_05920 [Oscillospiraceae bacterium]|nr:hypothetical protein [Oscillospiraceae bacterium]